MEVSLNLLNKYVKIDDQDPKELADKITSIGLEVEGMHSLANGNNMTIGYVKECIDHPDSDHLHVCQVEVRPGEVTQIVCGAPNVAAGQKVIVANPGCDLGEGFVIKQSTIRGQESNGMICSMAELGLDQRLLSPEDKDGIHVLDENAPVGADPLEYLGLKDTILDIGLTPNRADCMALTSLAYEVAAVLKRDVNLPEIKEKGMPGSNIEVKVETELCPFFGAKLVKGVTTKESPAWLKTALLASGIKPINNIVDISNYVMLETGQPIHMYDYDKLTKKEFVVKTGFDEKAILLDGEEYKLEPNDIIVSTDNGVGCVAGVMGADSTKIDENTQNIVIEVATFDGPSLRETARRLNLLTDASQHYIKGALNTANSLNILERCANLLEELADAKEIYETVSTTLYIEDKYVSVSTQQVNGLLGTSIQTNEIAEIFDSLKFKYELKEDTFNVKIPTYRNDITMAADLIDENTQNIVIEVATFDGPSLRETARRLNLLTDASQHYIKGALNTANSLNILERCANLLEELADAKEIYETVSTTLYIEDKYVSVSTQQVNGLLGTSIQTNEIAEIFDSLKFKYELKEDTFNVKIPTYRNDITMAADLIEEVVRMYGFDNIPSTLPEMSMTIGKRTEIQEKKHMMKVLLKDLGLHETLTYSLTSPSLVHDFNIFHDQEPVKLAMPLGEERSVTRQSIIGSLLQVINYNQSRNMKDVHLYELSTTYSKGVELQNLAIACTGEYHGLSFKQISYKADYYLVKGFVETIFERLGINESRYRLERVESDNQSFHPGRSAYIKVQNEVVGVVGQVHPLMEKKYDVKDVYVVELNLSALLNIKTGKVKYQPIPQYPSVSRDIALVMDESVQANDVCQKIIKSSNKLVKTTNIFDVYIGEHVEAGKKSVAINLTFQDDKKTLKEQEINEAMEKILKAVEKDFGAVLRG